MLLLKMATWNMFFFQNSNPFYYHHLIYLQNSIMMFMLMIMVLTSYLIADILNYKLINLYLLKNHFIEVIWTNIPMIIL